MISNLVTKPQGRYFYFLSTFKTYILAIWFRINFPLYFIILMIKCYNKLYQYIVNVRICLYEMCDFNTSSKIQFYFSFFKITFT